MMAAKKKPSKKTEPAVQFPAAEVRYKEELEALSEIDSHERPAGWRLSPSAVVDFICGTDGEKIRSTRGQRRSMVIDEKFVGSRDLVQRCVVTLAGQRSLLLVGEPGTAKSMLSELLAVAISGTSELAVQGTAGTTEDQVRYGWNYAMLLDRGPSKEALVPSPILEAMGRGSLVRFEEITRCLPEVQDALISLLSERRLMIPELEGEGRSVFAAPGFNVIATANLRDRGVSEMSAALKRRFNFETVPPIADAAREVALVAKNARASLALPDENAEIDRALVEMLVTVFRDLRSGRTDEGWQVQPPSSVMSTAEAVAVTAAIVREGTFFPSGFDPVSRLPGHLLGVVIKDDAKDRERLIAYWDGPLKRRSETGGPLWRRLHELRSVLEE